MSSLGFTSGQLEREQHALHRINSAAMALQAEAIGMKSRLSIEDSALADARTIIREFAMILRDALGGVHDELALRTMVSRVKSGSKPINDWIEDLTLLIDVLNSKGRVSSDHVGTLDDLVRLIDAGVTEDLYRLYGRR